MVDAKLRSLRTHTGTLRRRSESLKRPRHVAHRQRVGNNRALPSRNLSDHRPKFTTVAQIWRSRKSQGTADIGKIRDRRGIIKEHAEALWGQHRRPNGPARALYWVRVASMFARSEEATTTLEVFVTFV